jgi:hypothetical protein
MENEEVIMVLSPFPAGDGRPWPNQVFTTDTAIFPLTGLQNSTIVMHFEDINNNNVLYMCTGTWSITDGPNGKATFTPSVADLLPANPLGRAGVYLAYPVVTLTTGPVPMDGQLIQVQARP